MKDLYKDLEKNNFDLGPEDMPRSLRKALGGFFEELSDKVDNLTKTILKRDSSVSKVEVNNIKDFPKPEIVIPDEVKVKELPKDFNKVEVTKLPEDTSVKVSNLEDIKIPEVPKSIEVSNNDEIIKNLNKVSEAIEDLKEVIKNKKDIIIPPSQTIEFPKVQKVEVENQVKVPTSVKVENLNEIRIPEQPKTVTANVTFPKVQDVKVTNPPIVQKIEFPKTQKVEGMVGLKEGTIPTGEGDEVHFKKANPRKYSIVRLTDGQKFIDALGGGGMMAASGGGKSNYDSIINQGEIAWDYSSISSATTTVFRAVRSDETAYVVSLEVSTNTAQRVTIQVGSKVVYAASFGASGGAITRGWHEKVRGSGIAGDDITVTTSSNGQCDVFMTYVVIRSAS